MKTIVCECMIEAIINKQQLKDGINHYIEIMGMLSDPAIDVSKNVAFQKRYCSFYKLNTRNYSEDFKKEYFNIMQRNRKKKDISFETIFDQVSRIKTKPSAEMSFSSKMIHTLKPDEYPIWDSVVATAHFGMRVPADKKGQTWKERKLRCIEEYIEYKKRFVGLIENEDPGVMMMIERFKKEFKDIDISGISDIKILDFILWQDRALIRIE